MWFDFGISEDAIGAYQDKYAELKWAEDQPERMDPDFKKEWVAELRSGNHEQTTYKLFRIKPSAYTDREKPGKCCLGVVSDILVHKDYGLRWVQNEGGAIKSLNHDSLDIPSSGTLPSIVQNILHISETGDFVRWAEVDSDGRNSNHDPVIDPMKTTFDDRGFSTLSLTMLNDAGFTFDQIADVIDYFL